MNDDVKMREQLSALADGQLRGEEFAQAMKFAETDEGLATWQLYHLVGDVMRSAELARPADLAFLTNLRAEISKEPSSVDLVAGGPTLVAAPDATAVSSANASVFQWKMVAGIASLAAVAAIGWHTYSGLPGSPGVGPQLAVAPAATSRPQEAAVTVAESAAPAQPVMIRDPRLDELLAAHRQFGSTSSLQMPAGFLRNATFEAPPR